MVVDENTYECIATAKVGVSKEEIDEKAQSVKEGDNNLTQDSGEYCLFVPEKSGYYRFSSYGISLFDANLKMCEQEHSQIYELEQGNKYYFKFHEESLEIDFVRKIKVNLVNPELYQENLSSIFMFTGYRDEADNFCGYNFSLIYVTDGVHTIHKVDMADEGYVEIVIENLEVDENTTECTGEVKFISY